MSKNLSYSLVNEANGEKIDLPAVVGTLGPPGLDVGKVYDKLDVFTFDPWFTSTRSCQAAIASAHSPSNSHVRIQSRQVCSVFRNACAESTKCGGARCDWP